MTPTRQSTGRRDRRITVQKQIQGKGPTYGNATKEWIDFQLLWAFKYDSGGREFEMARQINPEIDTQFQVHWVPWLKPKMRFSYLGKIYHIVRIEEVGRRSKLNVYTKARG